jgi:uncharacterized repeat protein (TIGR01451 family)
MKRASCIAVLAVLGTAALVLAGAGSAAGTRPAAKTGTAGNAKSSATWVVTQIGQRNYAGPNCPGVSWNCTKATRVLQIATRSGTNTASCTVSPCSISQLGPAGASNVASCSIRQTTVPTATESCGITQRGANNRATIAEGIEQRTGSTQTAIQTINVTQGPAAGDTSTTNSLSVLQWATQTTSAASPQTQNAYMSMIVSQTAAGAGNNTTDLHQWQTQGESGSAAVQNQNASGTLPSGFSDCAPASAPSAPNACANVTQIADSGKNKNVLEQLINEDQKSSAVATQTQGSGAAGAEGTKHQEAGPAGNSTNNATEKKVHTQTGAPGSFQAATDPLRCCGTASQLGGSGNTDTINQTASLSGNANYHQSADLTGESHSPNGSCFIHHKITENAASSERSDGDSPCLFFVMTTSCESSGNEGSCSEDTESGAPISELTKGVRARSQEEFLTTTNACCGQSAEYQIVYSNVGNAPAHFVTVTDEVPSGLNFESCSAPEGASCSYNPYTQTVTWDLGTVNGDSSRTMGFVVSVVAECCQTISNTATATTEEESEPVDSNPAFIVVDD